MSEEAASNTDSKKTEHEATQSLEGSCEEVNNLKANSHPNDDTLTDSVNTASKVENHTDGKMNNQNNLDLCSEEVDWEHEVNIIADTSSQRPASVNNSQIISNQISEDNEPKKKPSADYYVVSNENTAEPLENSDTIENIGNLNTYRDSIIGGSDDTDSSDSASSSTVSEDDDVDSDNNSLGYDETYFRVTLVKLESIILYVHF